MTLEEARDFALSLPDAAEAPHFAMSSFRVQGKIFATVPAGGGHLHVFVDEHGARAIVAEGAPGCEELWWGKRLTGLRVALALADDALVRELLEEAWRRKASRGGKGRPSPPSV